MHLPVFIIRLLCIYVFVYQAYIRRNEKYMMETENVVSLIQILFLLSPKRYFLLYDEKNRVLPRNRGVLLDLKISDFG